MFSPRRFTSHLVLALLVVGCASATKRYEQGLELEMQGDYDAASARYVDALRRDPSLGEARERLDAVGRRAVSQHLGESVAWEARAAYVQAANEYRELDAVLANAQSVGVRIEIPASYDADRRVLFDRAIESLLVQSASATSRGLHAEALNAARQARTHYEPSIAQHRDAVAHEADALLHWSEDELAGGHLRDAYGRASAVVDLGAEVEQSRVAHAIMGDALDRGQVELMVLPAVVPRDGGRRDRRTRGGNGAALSDLEVGVNAAFGQGALRSPSPFVVLSDPIAVRDVVRQAGVLDGGVKSSALGLLTRLVDADYGAWLELESIDATEFEVHSSPRAVKTRDGAPASIVIEEGKRRLSAQAVVVVADVYGNELTSRKVVAAVEGPFRRGVYDGDPDDLNLGRREVDAFDVTSRAIAERALHQALADELAVVLAASVIDPVLALVP